MFSEFFLVFDVHAMNLMLKALFKFYALIFVIFNIS